MKNKILTLLLLIISFAAKSQTGTNSDSTEPNTEYTVRVNGKDYALTENETLHIDSILSRPTLSVKASDYKKFDKTSISFEYPRQLSFHFEEDSGIKNWTLSGNSFAIIVFEMDAPVTLSELADEFVRKIGKKNYQIEDTQKELGGQLCDVKKLTVMIVGVKSVIEFYAIKSNDFRTRIIYFQDSMENNVPSEEYEKGFERVASTITFK